MMEIVSVLRAYGAGQELERTSSIDGALQAKQGTDIERLRLGGHEYLAGSVTRVSKLLTWCAATVKNCIFVPKERWDEPLPNPPTHCGYTASFKRRDLQYDKKSGTTWLPLLVEAAFQVCFPKHGYLLTAMPVAFLGRHMEVPCAERALTRCTNSDFTSGGFCVVAAGQCSSANLEHLPPAERLARWEELENWRWEQTGFRKHAEEEEQRLLVLRSQPRVAAQPSLAELEALLAKDKAAAEQAEQELKEKLQATRERFADDPWFQDYLDKLARLAEED